MGKIYTYNLTKEELDQELSHGKNAFVNYLLENEIIDEETALRLKLDVAIITTKLSFFSKLWKHYVKKEDLGKTYYIIIEQKSFDHSKLLEKEENMESEDKKNPETVVSPRPESIV